MFPRSPHPGWIGVALSFYAFIVIGISDGSLGILLPSILATYHLTPGTITLLFLSQVTGFTIAATTSSLITSRIGLAQMLLSAAILLTSALSLYAFTTHWSVMVAAGTLLGLGHGLIDSGINTYIATDQRNATVMGMLHAFYGIGALIGPTLATTLLALKVDWQQIYCIIASFVILLIIGMMWTVLHRYEPMMRSPVSSSASSTLRSALNNPIVLAASLLLLIYVGTEVSLGNWAYTVQSVSRGIPTLIAGYSVSGYWLGLTLGRFLTGQIVKHLGADQTISVSLSLLVIGLLAWWLLPTQWWSLPLSGFALAAIFPTIIWSMPQRVSTATVPAAIGVLSSVGAIGSAAIPSAIGWFADRAGLDIIPILLLPLAASMVGLHTWLVRETSRKRKSS